MGWYRGRQGLGSFTAEGAPAVRPATPKRRWWGYDRQQTDELLADLARRYEQMRSERDALTMTVDELRGGQDERDRRENSAREEFLKELDDHAQQVFELEKQVASLKRENRQQAEEVKRLTEELLQTRAAQQRHQAEWDEQQATLARHEVRERALVEQVVMLKEELQHEATDVRV